MLPELCPVVVALEYTAGELRAVVRDDAFWHTETTYQPLDEFNGGSGWYPSHGLHLRPLGELVDGDEEETIAPEHSRERAQDVQPQTAKGHESGMVWSSCAG